MPSGEFSDIDQSSPTTFIMRMMMMVMTMVMMMIETTMMMIEGVNSALTNGGNQ